MVERSESRSKVATARQQLKNAGNYAISEVGASNIRTAARGTRNAVSGRRFTTVSKISERLSHPDQRDIHTADICREALRFDIAAATVKAFARKR